MPACKWRVSLIPRPCRFPFKQQQWQQQQEQHLRQHLQREERSQGLS